MATGMVKDSMHDSASQLSCAYFRVCEDDNGKTSWFNIPFSYNTKGEPIECEVPLSNMFDMNSILKMDAIGDMLCFMYNVSLGARITTSSRQDKFIDRYDRTFFKENGRISASLTQDSIFITSSFANYINTTCLDESTGTLELLFDDYLLFAGTFARRMSALSRSRMLEPPSSCASTLDQHMSNKRIMLSAPHAPGGNLKSLAVCEKDLESVMQALSDETTCLRFIIGCFISCMWHDHSTVRRDIESNRLRKRIDVYRNIIQSASYDPSSFCTEDNINAVAEIADCFPGAYIIIDSVNIIVNVDDSSRPFEDYIDV